MRNLDIHTIVPGQDLVLYASDAPRAVNVVSVQIGSLEYALSFGVDLSFYLGQDFSIQPESFQAYLVRRLTESQINVVEVIESIQSLYSNLTFGIGETE
jgi:hypothetical protein